MSAHHASPGHEHHEHHLDPHGSGAPHSTLGGYATGFVLSVILTAVPFALVMGHAIADPVVTAIVLLALAAVQIVVHMIYFLHMNARSEGGWNLLALMFTMALVVITLSGSLWVMYHMNHNMMPTMHQMREMP